MSAELEARRTAAAAVLTDYQNAAACADVAERAMWAARLADMLGYVLAAPAGAEGRKLTAIRQLLADFDWEFHDRQLALEEIDRIVGGQP